MKGTSFKIYISPVFLIYEATLILNMVPISPHSSTVIDKVFQEKNHLKREHKISYVTAQLKRKLRYSFSYLTPAESHLSPSNGLHSP